MLKICVYLQLCLFFIYVFKHKSVRAVEAKSATLPCGFSPSHLSQTPNFNFA